MRLFALAAACAASLWCTSANAAELVLNFGGSGKTGGSFPLFNPSLGGLNEVLVEATIDSGEALIRYDDNPPAVSVPITGAGFLDYLSFHSFALLTGSADYAAGATFGGASLSGAFAPQQYVGSSLIGFISTPGHTSDGFTTGAFFNLPAGVGGPLGFGLPATTTSLRVTYIYSSVEELGVPEPSSWAMMLLGFAGIGFQVRRQQRGRMKRA